MKSERMHNGFLRILFAGSPAEMAYMLLNIGRFLGTTALIERPSTWRSPPSDSKSARRWRRFILKNMGRLWVLLHQIPRLDTDLGAHQAQPNNPRASYHFQNLFNITISRAPSCSSSPSASHGVRPVLFLITFTSTESPRSTRRPIMPSLPGVPRCKPSGLIMCTNMDETYSGPQGPQIHARRSPRTGLP